jgi:hypothetical protein
VVDLVTQILDIENLGDQIAASPMAADTPPGA